MDLNLEVLSEKSERNEIFNFKEKERQLKFKDFTSQTSDFSISFENEKPLQQQICDWQNTRKLFCMKALRK